MLPAIYYYMPRPTGQQPSQSTRVLLLELARQLHSASKHWQVWLLWSSACSVCDNLEIMFISWYVIGCRRQLLERVQCYWQSDRHSHCGLPQTAAAPVRIIKLILDALKAEENHL